MTNVTPCLKDLRSRRAATGREGGLGSPRACVAYRDWSTVTDAWGVELDSLVVGSSCDLGVAAALMTSSIPSNTGGSQIKGTP